MDLAGTLKYEFSDTVKDVAVPGEGVVADVNVLTLTRPKRKQANLVCGLQGIFARAVQSMQVTALKTFADLEDAVEKIGGRNQKREDKLEENKDSYNEIFDTLMLASSHIPDDVDVTKKCYDLLNSGIAAWESDSGRSIPVKEVHLDELNPDEVFEVTVRYLAFFTKIARGL